MYLEQRELASDALARANPERNVNVRFGVGIDKPVRVKSGWVGPIGVILVDGGDVGHYGGACWDVVFAQIYVLDRPTCRKERDRWVYPECFSDACAEEGKL